MKNAERGFFGNLSRIVSVIFHPVFIPLLGLAVIFCAPTLLSFIPQRVKYLILLIVFVNNVFLPLAVILTLYSRGIIKSFTDNDRNERALMLGIMFLLYLVTTTLMVRLPVPNLIKAYFISTSFIVFITGIVNFFWRVSLHSVAAGGMLTLVCVLSYIFEVSMILYLTGMILLCGLVMFARLYNEDHSPAEVWSGFFLGALSMAVSLIILL